MQTKKNMVIEPDVTIPLPEGVKWAELITLIEQEKNQQFLKKISPATFKFLLKDNNRPKVVQALLKALKKNDPENATPEYTEKLIEIMKAIAQTI